MMSGISLEICGKGRVTWQHVTTNLSHWINILMDTRLQATVSKAIKIPTTILTSEDDMVVPVSDFADLPDNENIELLVTRYGGHCAFLKNWKMESLADDIIVERVLGNALRHP